MSEPARLGVVERNDIRSKGNQCHVSRCRPREQEIHQKGQN